MEVRTIWCTDTMRPWGMVRYSCRSQAPVTASHLTRCTLVAVIVPHVSSLFSRGRRHSRCCCSSTLQKIRAHRFVVFLLQPCESLHFRTSSLTTLRAAAIASLWTHRNPPLQFRTWRKRRHTVRSLKSGLLARNPIRCGVLSTCATASG